MRDLEELEAWEAQRLALYVDKAVALIALVQEYEDVHPSGAPCFYDVLDRMKAVLS